MIDWVQFHPIVQHDLDNIYAGICNGMMYKEINTYFQEELKQCQEDELDFTATQGPKVSPTWMPCLYIMETRSELSNIVATFII
eukprot:2440074-Ditylum_brightwellii.AAC.2